MKQTATREQYEKVFFNEKQSHYPEVDHWESSTGFEVDDDWLHERARVLACPVKANPPCWQHGRVIYSTVRAWIRDTDVFGRNGGPIQCLDIGTAKGFSALVIVRALLDSKVPFKLTSIDVIDPDAKARRNTIAEVDGLKTLYETVGQYEESRHVEFVLGKAENWLMMNRGRIHLAFVDGKHTYDAVKKELTFLTSSQESGDILILDDVHMPGVMKAAMECLKDYAFVTIRALPERAYMVAGKR